VGIVLSLAFFFRFQMGFAMIGLGVWLVFFEKASYRTLAGMSMGFAMGTAFNVFLDSTFYGALTFTPYPYWTVNVSDGRAMGLAPVWHYVGILSLALTAPPLSIALLPFVVRGLYRKIADPYSLSVFFFLLAHFVIPHKEPRFLFPIVGILPVILGYGVRDYLDRLPFRPKHAAWVVGVGAVVLVSLLVNTILLVTLLFVPVAQHVAFAKKLNDYFDGGAPVKLIFYQRTPYQTPVARNVATYYVLAQKPNIETRTIEDRSQFLNRVKKHKKGTYFVSTYDRLVRDNLVAEMDCIPLARSSELLLLVNPWWQERSGTVLPELWTLYDCEGARAKKPRGAHRQS
jgi:hypothetical protein